MAARFTAVVLLLGVAAHVAQAAQMPFSADTISRVANELAQTAAASTEFGRQLHQAATTSGSSMMTGLSGLQNLAGSAAASNAASNNGASAAAAVSSAEQSLAQQWGSQVTSVSDVQQQLELLLQEFCANPEYTAPAQVPATWAGSSATIALVPHTCLIFPENNTLACSPAQLVLYNTAGSYNKAYTSAASWTGTECKISEQLGSGSTQVVGGAPYTVDIPEPVQLQPLWTPILPNAPALAPEAGAAAAAASVSDSGSSDPPIKKPSKKRPTKMSGGGGGGGGGGGNGTVSATGGSSGTSANTGGGSASSGR